MDKESKSGKLSMSICVCVCVYYVNAVNSMPPFAELTTPTIHN